MQKKSLFILILFLLKNMITFSQNGSLQIEVKDEKSKEELPAAVVVIKSLHGFSKNTITDLEGKTVIRDLLPGKYILEIIYVGYKNSSYNVTIVSEKSETIKVRMQPVAIELSVCEIQSDVSEKIIACTAICTISECYTRGCRRCCGCWAECIVSKKDSLKEEMAAVPAALFKCYPNPTTGILFVEPTEHAKGLAIMDMAGRVIQQQVINEIQQLTLDFSSYAPGVYFVNCITGDKIYSERVVVTQ